MREWKNCTYLLLAAILCGSPGWSAPEEEEELMLLGRCTPQQLGEEPFAVDRRNKLPALRGV